MAKADPAAALAPCPRCASTDIWPEAATVDPWGLYCRACQWTGPRSGGDDPDTAVAAWNREARQVAEARQLGLAVNLRQVLPLADELA